MMSSWVPQRRRLTCSRPAVDELAVWWGAGGLAGVIPGSILSAGSPGCAPVARPRVGRLPRRVGGRRDRKSTVAARPDVRSTMCERSSACIERWDVAQAEGVCGGVGTKTWSGGDDRACLVRSLRAEKALSVAFESRLAWLTRVLLPPEPLGVLKPTRTRIATPADGEPRKMNKKASQVLRLQRRAKSRTMGARRHSERKGR